MQTSLVVGEMALRFQGEDEKKVVLRGTPVCNIDLIHREGSFCLLRGDPCVCTKPIAEQAKCLLWMFSTKFLLVKLMRQEGEWHIFRTMQKVEPGYEWKEVKKEILENMGMLDRYEQKYKPPKRSRVKLN